MAISVDDRAEPQRSRNLSTGQAGSGRTLRPARGGMWPAAVVIMVGLGGAVVQPLNGDIRFEAGAESASWWGIAETFTHRPLAYRLMTAAAFAPARLFGEGGAGFEIALQVIALVLCAAAAARLGRALVRRGVPGPVAGPLAVAVGAAAAFQGAVSVWEPDWLATVLTVLAVAVGLTGAGRRTRLVTGLLAGILLAAAAAIKIVTLPIALIGLIAIGWLDRRRAPVVLGSAVAAGLAWIGVVAVRWPVELTWLIELSVLQPNQDGLLGRAASGLGGALLTWPVLIMVPAAILLLSAGRSGTDRLRTGGVLAAVVLLGLAPAILQRQYFVYHFAALPVLAGALLVPAAVRAGRVGASRLLAGLVTGTIAAAVLTRMPADWRLQHQAAILAGLGALMIITAVAVRPRPGIRPRPSDDRLWPAAVIAAASMITTLLPGQTSTVPLVDGPAGLLNVNTAAVTAAQRETGRRIRAELGAGTPVLYLAYGELAYFVGNATPCRYLSPTWLQRARYNPEIRHTRSYADNLSCLAAPEPRVLLLQTDWFRLGRQPASLRQAIERRYDCSTAPEIDGILLCPRR
ncbi:hypothetical protein [Microlunatus sp. GCM10028923]|uniref:hypothetical protein n=1 Tax=Microlunatus sp. GCM10028923 TaxID=3273400 RepID=UPI00362123B2